VGAVAQKTMFVATWYFREIEKPSCHRLIDLQLVAAVH